MDLAKEQTIDSIRIYHEGVMPGGLVYTTSDFTLQHSDTPDGPWKNLLEPVKENTAGITEHYFAPIKTRYVRILIEAGAHVEATTLYGHLELHPAAWGDPGTMIRSESLNMLAPLDDAETLRSAGAALGRHELVAYTLAALDAAQA